MKNNLNLTSLQAQAILEAKKKQNDALSLFRPTPQQEECIRDMELETLLEMLLGGGNRAGKSVLAAVMITALIKNQPIMFRDGTLHHMRPPHWRNEPLKIWIVGYDWKHIGKTIYRLLFKKDLFRVIRDQKTGKWRSWDPTLPGESEQFENTRPSPPLLKMTDVAGGEDGISWENKKANQIESFEIEHDGTRVEFFASTGARPQGDPAHVIWVDEKIEDGRWYSELLTRLMDRRGRILWTAWPDTAPSPEMNALSDRAKEQVGTPDQRSFHVYLEGDKNPYTASKHREAIMATMDEDERQARDKGVLNLDRWRPYARFDQYRHRALSINPDGDDKLAAAIRANCGIPGTWTRYLILDPGTNHPAVLMVAVPPPEIGDFIVPYQELYPGTCPAGELAPMTAAMIKGTAIEDMIIDAHAARQTPMGFDGTIGENYEEEFRKAGIKSRRRGSRFSYGSDNISRRIRGVQGTLNSREDNSVKLRIYGCDKLVKQLRSYRWGQNPKGEPTEEPAKYQRIDLAQCLEYFVSREDCGYVPPRTVAAKQDNLFQTALKSLRASLGSHPRADDQSVYCGSGSRPA